MGIYIRYKHLPYILSLVIFLFFINCASNQKGSSLDELDTAVREASNYLNNNVPKGNKLVILNFQSVHQALSEYVIDELVSNTVNDRVFTVVDRANLALILAEHNFQMSGEVSDESAVSIGQMLGAQTIVSGAISQIGDLFRLRVRALDVKTTEIQGQFNRNIPNSPTISLLIGSSSAASRNSVTVANAASRQTSVTYKIGDTGPAGGIIFYDKGNSAGGWRFLEAAPASTESKVIWSHERRSIDSVVNQRALGLGKQNTQKIMEVFNSRGGGFDTAARACIDLNINGFNDWFLPSFDELNWMYGNLHRKGLGDFKNDSYSYYWSSTQENSSSTFVIDFSNGRQTRHDIIYSGYVRAIRQF